LGRVQVFEEVTLLETEDPVMLQELLAATSLREAIRGWLAPTWWSSTRTLWTAC